jgi:adenylate cyclase
VTAGLLAAVLAATETVHRLLPEVFEPLADQVTDRLFTLRADVEGLRPFYDDVVVHVTIDDASLRERLDHYLDRAEYARLVSNLGRAGVAAQFHDSVFAAPQGSPQDEELIRATTEAGNVYYGMAAGLAPGPPSGASRQIDPGVRGVLDANRWSVRVEGDASRIPVAARPFPTFPALTRAARGIGFLDIEADSDGVYRRTPLLARDGDRFVPSLSLRVVCDYLGVEPDRIVVRPGRSIVLQDARRPGDREVGDIEIPVDRQGRMTVNYLGPWGRMTQYPMMAVYDASDDRFEMEDLRDELQGRIAIVSEVATGQGDVGPVPADPVYPLAGVHANVMNDILTGQFLRELTPLATLFWIEVPLLAVFLFASLRLRTIPFVLFAAGLVLAYHVAAVVAFLAGNLIVNIPRPVIFMVGSTIVVAAYHYHLESSARAVLRTTFDAYFPPPVVDKVMAHSERLSSAAQKKELTILFSDIASFTRHTARMEAGRVRDLLNEYFERMIEIAFEEGGTLDKFIGDGMMVFFGDPEDQPDHAVRCVRAALRMQRAARALDETWRKRGDMPLRIRIGINTGQVIVGNMGSSRRLSYTALGEPVNLAQRLESSAPAGGILISARTHELLDGAMDTLPLEPLRVKGIDTPVAVYAVPTEPGSCEGDDAASRDQVRPARRTSEVGV